MTLHNKKLPPPKRMTDKELAEQRIKDAAAIRGVSVESFKEKIK